VNMATFDTLAFSRRLRGAGFNEDQAEAVVDVVTQAVEGGVATRADVHDVGMAVTNLRAELKQDIADLRTELKQDTASLRTELKQDTASLRTELKQDTASLRTELKQDIAKVRVEMADMRSELIRWMVGLMLAQATIIIGAIKLIG